MKKLFFILLTGMLMYACGDNEGDKKDDSATKPADTAVTPPPAAGGGATVANEKGLELIGSSDCMACHALDRKVIGPAYVEVAKKYENTEVVIDTLVSKIIHGGMGVWGNVPMTPHPDLPEADAREMVKYILSLKNQ